MTKIEILTHYKIPNACITKNVRKGIFTYDVLPHKVYDYHIEAIEKFIKENPHEVNPEKAEQDIIRRRKANQEYRLRDIEKYNAMKRKKYLKYRKKVLARNLNNYFKKRDEKIEKYKEYSKRESSRIKSRARVKKWRLKNIEKVRESARQRCRTESDRLKRKQYREKNKHKIYANLSIRKKTDVGFRIVSIMRRAFLKALEGKHKYKPVTDILGCSIQEFKDMMKNKFTEGMDWTNHGTYFHLDHIIPCAAWDFTKKEAQEKCFHHSNYQPLHKIKNLSKQDKIPLDFLLSLPPDTISCLKPKYQQLYHEHKNNKSVAA